MKKVAVIISPNWRDYAEKYLTDCVESIRKQNYQGEIKIFITDNETTFESFNFISKTVPEADIVLNNKNDGYAKGCNDSIREALRQGYEYIAIFNIHTVLEPDCLSRMIEVLNSDKEIGAVQARMMLFNEKEKISSLGNVTHFLGFGYCDYYSEVWKNQISGIKNIFYPSGSSILTKKEFLEKVGLFDEEYWMYNEDQELGWRMWLAGFKCVLAPDAIMYNKFDFKRSGKKFYWIDRNRIITILKCYHILTLILILPAFIIMELGLILFSLKTGWFKEKLKMWKYFLSPRTWKYIIRSRQHVQKLRKRKDSEIVKMISGRIWYQEVDDIKLRIINPVFDAYWKIAKKIIIW